MAHYRASIDIQQPREDVFAYLSDFSTTREWDPGVVEAKRLNGQAVGEGTEFRLVAAHRIMHEATGDLISVCCTLPIPARYTSAVPTPR